VVPDNVLFGGGVGHKVRTALLDECDVHTVLRLPAGIFYAQGIKTNVVFLRRSDEGTSAVWIYDLRRGSASGRRRSLSAEHFTEFEALYGPDAADPHRHRVQYLANDHPRFRVFRRDEIVANQDSLDFDWPDESGTRNKDEFDAPSMLTAVIDDLRAALAELEDLSSTLRRGS
jgi:type I restriction enzyme M protein